MSYKDDNLEALYRKAARDYPLNTDNSDWEDIAAKLSNAYKQKVSVKHKIVKYAALLLLLTGGSLIMYNFQFKLKSTGKLPIAKQYGSKNKGENNNQGKPVEFSKADGVSVSHEGADLKLANESSTSIENRNVRSVNANSYFTVNSNIEHAMLRSPSDLGLIAQDAENKRQNKQTENIEVEKKFAEVNVKQNFSKNETGLISRKSKKQVIRLKPSYKLYGSLYGGPQFSMVQFQQINKPGYKIGISLGYRINTRFSVELGLQRERLNFYSDGKYIDTSMLRLKANTAIESVNASSKITSVPIALKYNFSSKRPGHFFVTAGVNAVMITHNEQYKYSVTKDGVEDDLSKNYSALTSPKYFTGINVSAGYETRLYGMWNVKMEPYYQAPISDLGVGRLPVSNFGVNIGIIRDLK